MKKTKITLTACVAAFLSSAVIFNSCASNNTKKIESSNTITVTLAPSSPKPVVKTEPAKTETVKIEPAKEPKKTVVPEIKEEPVPEVKEEPVIVIQPEPEPEPVKVPEVSPDVLFVRQIQEALANGDMDQAIALFQNVPEGVTLTTGLKMILASLYYSNAQYSDSISTCDSILAVEPANSDALELKALCYYASGNKTAYKAAQDEILKKDPNNPTINIQKAEDYAVNKKYKLARDSYKKALTNDKQNEQALFGYGQMSYYLDDVKTARQTFQQILEINPENDTALSYMGKLSAEDENYLRAHNYIKQALDVNPYNYDYWIDYGTYLRYLGKADDACAAWKHAAELDPEYFLAYTYLAGNYDERSMFDEALTYYKKVIKTNPKYFYAYEEMGILAYHMKNYDDAIKYFREAYKYSDSWAYKLMISACFTKKGDKYNAKNELTPVLKKLERNSIEYDMIRFYTEAYSRNAENSLVQKITKEQNSTTRGKMLFYMGLYNELAGADTAANEYYAKVTAMNAPMFFEYRIAEWGLGI